MPREILNNGTVANDGSGDSLRDAIGKVNNNFIEIYNKIGGTDSGEYLSPNVRFDSNNVIFGTTNELSLGPDTLTGDRDIRLPDTSGTLLIDQDNQVLRNPNLIGDILDSNSNELLSFTSVSSPVNQISISNSSTGNAVILTTTGADSDIDLNLEAKGEGEVTINAGLVLSTEIITAASATININKPFTLFNRATAIAATLGSAHQIGHIIRVININAGTATVSGTFLGGNVSATIPQNEFAEFLWTGAAWAIHADAGVTIA